MRRGTVYLVMLLICLAGIAHGQTATVRGFVYAKETGEPVLFTYVYLKQKDTTKTETFGVTTNDQGYYSISRVPAGEYILTVTNIEFDKFEQEITLKKGALVTRKINLTAEDRVLEEYVVSAEKQERQTEVRMSMIPATKKDIESVPMVGGSKDIVNYITAAVPGAITTGDQGGQVYIRGGSPIQNKVLLDGMVIYNPFHSIGFFSVFDTDIIRTADIYTGGFNAEFGGRISSIMDIQTRDGNKNKFSGVVGANPFGAKVLLEGPIWNNSEEGGSSASYIFSGKTSYLEQTSKVVYPYANDDVDEEGNPVGLPFNYTDLYAKASINGSNGSKFNVFGFNYLDSVEYRAVSQLKWNSWGIGSNFVLVPQGSPVLVEGDFSFSKYKINLKEEELAPRFSNVQGFNLGFDFTYFLRKDEVKYGIQVKGFNTNFSTFNSVGRKIEQDENTTEIAGYVKYKLVRGVWVVEPSFRAHYYASFPEFSPEPRLGIKYNATENLRFKGATGIYSQNLISANSDRDVVNLFYGFLSGPSNLQSEFVTEEGEVRDITHPLQKAIHYILGVEYDFTDNFTLNVEGYVKDFRQLTNMNRNKIFDEDDFDQPDVFKKDYIVETGLARGVDVLLKYSTENMSFWAIYSLGKVDRWDGLISYAPVFDRRHNVNLVATYIWGEDDSWEVNGRWNFGSGLPFTQTQGYYQQVTFDEGSYEDYWASNPDDLATIYAELNKGRLTTYHRLDLTLTKRIKFTEKSEDETKRDKVKSELELIAGVTNLYNRKNIFYVNRITAEQVNQLPIMPSIGFNWDF